MKKGWKVFWIVCAVCVGVGFSCCVIALAMGVTLETIEDRFPNGIRLGNGIGIFVDDDWDEGPDIEITEGNDMQRFSGVNSIDAEIWAGQVEVRIASEDSGEITIETENVDKRLNLKCYMDGDELKLRTKKRVTGIKNGVGTVYIYIPQNYHLEDVSMEIGAGYLYVENIVAQELSVEVGAGEAVIDDFIAEEADFDCGAGTLTVSGEATREVDIDCGVGEIAYTAAGSQGDYNYKIDCGIGEVTCGESSYSGIGAEKKIQNGAAREMNIDCGIGEVTVSFAAGSMNHHIEE